MGKKKEPEITRIGCLFGSITIAIAISALIGIPYAVIRLIQITLK